MKTLNTFIEPDYIDYSARYRFDPLEDGRCSMSRKGKIVLHRRLVAIVFGANFPKVHLKVVEQKNENGSFHSLILRPVKEPQLDLINVFRYKYSGLLVLNCLFYRLNLNYKRFRFSFISEPVTFDDGCVGIRLTYQDASPWPEFLHLSDVSKADDEELVEMNQSRLPDSALDAPLLTPIAIPQDQPATDEEQVKALFMAFLDSQTNQRNEMDSFEFEQNFDRFSKHMNQILLQMARPNFQ